MGKQPTPKKEYLKILKKDIKKKKYDLNTAIKHAAEKLWSIQKYYYGDRLIF